MVAVSGISTATAFRLRPRVERTGITVALEIEVADKSCTTASSADSVTAVADAASAMMKRYDEGYDEIKDEK